MALLELPSPPAIGRGFAPAIELAEWAQATFIDSSGPLYNPDHEHLEMADLLCVWGPPLKSRGLEVVGTAQMGKQQGGGGKRELLEWLYTEWNGGELPDFVITVSAAYVKNASPHAVCALIEHELYHCGQALDAYGQPRYTKHGLPIFALRGHDVEEFVGVVKRYGAVGEKMNELEDALRNPVGRIGYERIEHAVCGCGAKVG